MVQIFPFRGLRYNAEKISDLTAVTAPPYDVIDEGMQQGLYDSHSNNIVRLILNKEATSDTAQDNVYTRAAQCLGEWQKSEVISCEEEPAFYAYSQSWQADGETIERKGMIGLVKLEPFGEGVLPHEKTLKKYVTDRLNLAKATCANLSQIFMIYDDPECVMEKTLFAGDSDSRNTWLKAVDPENVVHRFQPVMDLATVRTLQKLFSDKKLLIADGHHRYTTALALKEEVRQYLKETKGLNPPDGALLTDYLMVFVSNLRDPGLKVYPTHRVLTQWPEGFDKSTFELDLVKYYDLCDESDYDFIYHGTKGSPTWYLKLKDSNSLEGVPDLMRSMDVVNLEEVIFKQIFKQPAEALKANKILRFDRDETTVKELISSGEAVAVFRMRTPSVKQVLEVCQAGYLMPQKSTFFAPKILSGLVLYSYQNFPGTTENALSFIAGEALTLQPEMLTALTPTHSV